MSMDDDSRPPFYPKSIDDPFLKIPPPIQPDNLDPPPGCILLDPYGYISDRTNDTTADGITRGGKDIKVTFWAAHPPRASCFTVYSPDLDLSDFGGMPRILTTEDDLALLRVPICPPGCSRHPWNNNYFVYRAGTKNKKPSLDLIRVPGVRFSDFDACLLRCRARDTYFVAILCWALGKGEYNLHLYNSQTKTWSNKLMHLDSRRQVLYTYSSKAITIGGELGSVGWVDLWRGILICDVLLENHELRYIPLPSQLVPKPLNGPPLLIRDIIVRKGDIKYFEMHIDIGPGPAIEGWAAATWIWKGSWNKWEKDCTIRVPKDSTRTQVLPHLQEEQPYLKGLYSGYPALSLHDRDVVYIMDRYSLKDKTSSVIAIDVRKRTIKCVADYGSGRPLGCSFMYFTSGISKHLRATSSTRGNADEMSKNGFVQAGRQEVPGEGVKAEGRNRKCRGRRGHRK